MRSVYCHRHTGELYEIGKSGMVPGQLFAFTISATGEIDTHWFSRNMVRALFVYIGRI